MGEGGLGIGGEPKPNTKHWEALMEERDKHVGKNV